MVLAALKTDAIRRLAMIGLSVAAILAMMRNFARIGLRSEMRFTMLLLLVAGCLGTWLQDSIYFHEHWAAMLIVLSLGLYRPDRYVLSIVAALAACLIRELAVGFVLTMLLFALLERRWKEALHWGIGLAVFALAYGAHAHFAMETYRPGDLESPSWLALGGIPFVLETARRSVLLVLMPAGIVGTFVVLTVLGLVGCRDSLISRIAFFICGCLVAFLFVGRPNNGYWGLLLAPLLPLGIAFAPAAIRDLGLAARGVFVPVRHT
jgi:hypothetical protein